MSDAAPQYTFMNVGRGDPAASIAQRLPVLQSKLDGLAGRYVVLCFYVSATDARGEAIREALQAEVSRADPAVVRYCAVALSPSDGAWLEPLGELAFVLDRDREIGRAFGVLPREKVPPGQRVPARPCWIVLDPTLHVLEVFHSLADGPDRQGVADFIAGLPTPSKFSPIELPPPVLILPNVFDRDLCERLIAAYDRHGGRETGVVINSETVVDNTTKRRKDYTIQEGDLIEDAHRAMRKRILPEIERLFFMRITNVDRNIVACYAAEDGGHFLRPHRDNASDVTAYRRFAVSINLGDDFEGGAVQFPEYNEVEYRAPPGWAVVFPCAILHRVTKVTRGRRYVFLPFVFDQSGAQLRDQRQNPPP